MTLMKYFERQPAWQVSLLNPSIPKSPAQRWHRATLPVIILGLILGLSPSSHAQYGRADTRQITDYRGNYQRVSVGGYDYPSAFEIRNGTLWGWGSNYTGKLGDGTRTDRSTPTAIGTDNNWVTICTSEQFTLGLKSDGTLWGWGNNYSGQLGNGAQDFSHSNNPSNSHPISRIGNDNKWVNVSLSWGESVFGVKSDGTLWAWGYAYNGELGNGSQASPRTTPQQIGSDTKWVAVSGGITFSIGLKNDGTLWGWGWQAGNGVGGGLTTSPTQIGTDTKWVAISAGYDHSLALKSDGTLWAWGNGYTGSPTQVGTDTKWVAVNAGRGFSVGIKSDGTLWAWGDNSSGQLGDGTSTSQANPKQIGTDTKWVAADAGGRMTVAQKSDGTIWTGGFNSYGELGDGTTTSRTSPVTISSALSNWVSVAEGANHTVGLKSDGNVYTWGDNAFGQLGDGTTTQNVSPTQINSLTGVVGIAAGEAHTVALKVNGTVLAWGDNTTGQLGDNTTNQRNIPTPINSFTGIVGIAAGKAHSIALRVNGTLWAWGDNSSGQLGDGTTTQHNVPAQISSFTGCVGVAAGQAHSIAVKSNGTLWTWGDNTYGQLGDGSNSQQKSPVQIAGNWVRVMAGKNHTVGLKSDGTIWAWGANSKGQLGDGTTTDSPIPMQIGTDHTWISITAGATHTLARKTDGTLWVWGDNSNGQLGNGTGADISSPLSVSTTSIVMGLPKGSQAIHSVLISNSRVNLCESGNNSNGQLGDGSTVSTNLFSCVAAPPVPPLSLTTVVSPTTGCAGSSVALSVSVTNGTTPYSYTWTAPAGSSITGSGSAVTGNLSSTATGVQTFTVTVADSGTSVLTNTKTVSVTVVGISITQQPAATSVVCVGGSISIPVSASGGINSYQWYKDNALVSGQTSNTLTINPIGLTDVGEYKLVITGTCTSVTTTGFTLTVSEPLGITEQPATSSVVCAGIVVSVPASITGIGGSYQWYKSMPSGPIPVVGQTTSTLSLTTPTITDSGVYLLVASGGCNSVTTSAFNLTVNASPTVSVNPPSQTLCGAASVTLTASSATSYQWSDGTTGQTLSFTPTSTTTLSVTGTTNGCSATASAIITVVPAVTASISANPSLTVCPGGSATLTASGGANYHWSTNDSSPAIVVNATQTYSVTVSTASCSAVASVNFLVSTIPPPSLTLLSSSTNVCEGQTVAIAANVSGVITSLQWYKDGQSLAPMGQSATLTLGSAQPNHAGQYVLVVAGACLSLTSTPLSLTVNLLPTVTIFFPTSASVNPSGPVITVPVGQGLNYQVFGGGVGGHYHRVIVIDRIGGYEIRTTADNGDGIFPLDRQGPYTITVTDAKGCSRTVTGVIVAR